MLSADADAPTPRPSGPIEASADEMRRAELTRRAAFPSPLDRAADAYIVRRGRGRTVVAGYPWFTDWGRDTFIALRGLLLATHRLAEATDILIEWSDALSDGMLPNRFPDVDHQGTAWPWLIGPFAEAWLRVHGNTAGNRATARRRFVEPLMAHLEVAGLGHVSEIVDAEPPFTPRGCPFQAWSLGELLRLDRVVLAPPRKTRSE